MYTDQCYPSSMQVLFMSHRASVTGSTRTGSLPTVAMVIPLEGTSFGVLLEASGRCFSMVSLVGMSTKTRVQSFSVKISIMAW